MSATVEVDLVAQADQEAAEAAAEVELLEQQVRDGNEKITPAQLDKARGFARFAELRRTAARTKAERQRIAAARKELADATADLEKTGAGSLKDSQEQISSALAETQAALGKLRELAAAHNRIVKHHTTRLLASCKELPPGDVRQVAVGIFDIGGVRVAGGSLRADDWSANAVTTEAAFCAAIAPALEGLDLGWWTTGGGAVIKRTYVQARADGFRP